MEKILIATKNKDKFEIVTKILNKINNVSYEYYSLYDIKNLEKVIKKKEILKRELIIKQIKYIQVLKKMILNI